MPPVAWSPIRHSLPVVDAIGRLARTRHKKSIVGRAVVAHVRSFVLRPKGFGFVSGGTVHDRDRNRHAGPCEGWLVLFLDRPDQRADRLPGLRADLLGAAGCGQVPGEPGGSPARSVLLRLDAVLPDAVDSAAGRPADPAPRPGP